MSETIFRVDRGAAFGTNLTSSRRTPGRRKVGRRLFPLHGNDACTAASNLLAAISELVQPEASRHRAQKDAGKKSAGKGAARVGGDMSSITADGLAAPVASPAGGEVGPLEQKHLQYANYRAVAGSGEITKTHWHIASRQRARLGLRRHGRRDLCADLAAGDQGIRAHRSANIVPACRSRCSSASPASISGHGCPTGSGGARCSRSTSRCSRC